MNKSHMVFANILFESSKMILETHLKGVRQMTSVLQAWSEVT